MQNHKKDIRFSCPLDCFDACGLEATVIDDRVSRIRGDRDHPLTRGICCIKGLKLLERLDHPQRLTSPLKRAGRKWVPLTWPEALDDIADRLTRTIGQFGSAAILNYAGSGICGNRLQGGDRFIYDRHGPPRRPRPAVHQRSRRGRHHPLQHVLTLCQSLRAGGFATGFLRWASRPLTTIVSYTLCRQLKV
ncbi:MAG: molybdopterin-dependent oxidoreductase [Desulfobacterales bacterium]|jgi:hypothetical protein